MELENLFRGLFRQLLAQVQDSSYTNWGGEVVYINSNVTVLSGKELDMGSNTKVIFNAGHGYRLTMMVFICPRYFR